MSQIFKTIRDEVLSLLERELRENREERKAVFEWLKSHFNIATKNDLKEMEDRMGKRLTEIKSDIAAAAAQSAEALAELKAKLEQQQQLIEKLIADANDPEITDDVFLRNLETLKTNNQALADIIPNAPGPEPEPTEPTEPGNNPA